MDCNIVSKFDTELAQHAPWIDYRTRAIGGRFIPPWRQPQQWPRIARAQGANDKIVFIRRVFDDDHVMALVAQQVHLFEDRRRVRQQSTFEFRIHPGAGNDPRSVMGTYFVFVKVQPCVDGGWIDQAYLPTEPDFFPSDCSRVNEIFGMSASASENLTQVR